MTTKEIMDRAVARCRAEHMAAISHACRYCYAVTITEGLEAERKRCAEWVRSGAGSTRWRHQENGSIASILKEVADGIERSHES
jgi:DNA repair photolyase